MMFVVEGDPGYIIGRDPVTNEPMLLPVQGSSEKALAITPEKRARILKQAKKESG
jgi:hypothetical protein